MKSFLSIPAQLIAVIIAVVLFGNMLPGTVVVACYTFSVIFKQLLSIILPFMVFFFVTAGILSFKRNAPVVLAVLLGSVFFSNAVVAMVSYVTMMFVGSEISCDTSLASAIAQSGPIEPLFILSLPSVLDGVLSYFDAVYALIAALAFGIVGSFFDIAWFKNFSRTGKQWVEYIISRLFIPLLPLYVFGFLLKIHAEGMFSCLFQQYGSAFILILSLQIGYLAWLYFVASGFSLRRAWQAIQIALPSYITAFSTMSSAAAIPISIKSAEQNTGNPQLAGVAMPIMANVHLLGDSIVTPILAMVTMMVFQGVLPGFAQYVSFVFYFCFAMFAVSGIPGGGILVMIPILKSNLGFSSEMISVITTIYFLLDAFGTGANVMGDGALVIIVNKILKRLGVAH